ncbi:unnamed protein product [Ixodes pacificus]
MPSMPGDLVGLMLKSEERKSSSFIGKRKAEVSLFSLSASGSDVFCGTLVEFTKKELKRSVISVKFSPKLRFITSSTVRLQFEPRKLLTIDQVSAELPRAFANFPLKCCRFAERSNALALFLATRNSERNSSSVGARRLRAHRTSFSLMAARTSSFNQTHSGLRFFIVTVRLDKSLKDLISSTNFA